MRILSLTLFSLAAAMAAVWALLFYWIQGMACGFSPTTGPCRLKMPWDMHGEDLLLLVVIPWSIVLILLGIAMFARRRSRR